MLEQAVSVFLLLLFSVLYKVIFKTQICSRLPQSVLYIELTPSHPTRLP